MNRAPNIGTWVYVGPNNVCGACTGVVQFVYRSYEWDEERERQSTQLRPESEWAVRVKVDRKPEPWAYGVNDLFAPPVERIERIAVRRGWLNGLRCWRVVVGAGDVGVALPHTEKPHHWAAVPPDHDLYAAPTYDFTTRDATVRHVLAQYVQRQQARFTYIGEQA